MGASLRLQSPSEELRELMVRLEEDGLPLEAVGEMAGVSVGPYVDSPQRRDD